VEQLSNEQTSRKESGIREQAPAQNQKPLEFFGTNIASVETVLQLPKDTRNTCLARTLNREAVCIPLPKPDVNASSSYAINQLPSTHSTLLRALGTIFPDQSGSDSELLLADFEQVPDSSLVTAATLGADSQAKDGRPAIWIGSEGGNIFKIISASGQITVTRRQVPFASKINFVAFTSPERGWIWTPSGGERRINLPAAAETFDGGQRWQRLDYRWLPAPWVFIAFILGAIAFERGTTAQMKLRRVVTEKYIADYGVSDDPIGLNDVDALGLRPIARSMARFLRNTETRPTVAIAVTGPWGSGKTSLMNLVKEEFDARDVHTVWFNAWHNQKEENLLAALLAAIRNQAVPRLWTVSGFIYRLRVAWRRMGADPNATIALAVFAIVAFYIVAKHLDAAARILGDFADWIGSIIPKSDHPQVTKTPGASSDITSIGWSAGGITALVYAGKKLWDLFKPLKSLPADLLSTFSGQSSLKEIDQQLSFRYRFASEFSIFCDTLRRPPHPGLVIFIDDLDRCAPKQTVDILEAINFVTSTRNHS
jgi:hypothetical protein